MVSFFVEEVAKAKMSSSNYRCFGDSKLIEVIESNKMGKDGNGWEKGGEIRDFVRNSKKEKEMVETDRVLQRW